MSETEQSTDKPGKTPEPAANADPQVALAGTSPGDGMAPLGQGAQVELTGDAQAAARGGIHAEITENTYARDRAIQKGHVRPGATKEAVRSAMMHQWSEEADPEPDNAPGKSRKAKS